MQIALRIDNALIAPAINAPAYRSSNPCIGCLSRPQCLHKDIDIRQLVNPANHYVQKFKVKKGDSIFNNGDHHRHFFNIRIGHVKIEHSIPNGQYQITQFGMPGDLLGLDGIANGKHRLAAYALSDGEICSINVMQLHAAMKADPSLLKIIEQVMSATLNHIQDHVFSLGVHSVEQKLAYFLIQYRNNLDHLHLRVDKLRLPMNREELSNYLGMTIETLSRSFAFLEKNGYITVKNKDISFTNFEGLGRFLEPKQ